MRITIAKDAGYCFGVRDAVDLAYKTAKEHDEVYMLGDIVHNESVVSDLNKVGAKVVDSINDVPENRKILFRAHGTVPEIWKKASESGKTIIDATCPLVHKIHKEVKELEHEGRKIVVIGDHGHDEVVGIAAQVKEAIIISNEKEAREMKKYRKIGVVSQSTQMIENVNEIIKVLISKIYDIRFINTLFCFNLRTSQLPIPRIQIFDIVSCHKLCYFGFKFFIPNLF